MYATTTQARAILKQVLGTQYRKGWTDATTPADPQRRSVIVPVSNFDATDALPKIRAALDTAGFKESTVKVTRAAFSYVRVIAYKG